MRTILSNLNKGIMTLTLNRPDALNAMRQVDFVLLLECIENFRDDQHAEVLILTGNGRGFCSGEDLKEIADENEMTSVNVRGQIELLQKITTELYELDKPTIAAINGPAIGFGLEVTLAFDIRIAAEEAWFWFSEAKRGLLPTNGAFYLLPRIVGLGHAARLMLTSVKVQANEALALGLVSEVCKAQDLLQGVQTLAENLVESTSQSIVLIKHLLRQSYSLGMSELMDLEVKGSIDLYDRGMSVAGAQAFTAPA
jgi:2-(1,2-epoxy-1,2-dihydrophenyl)acetyl-CoA isomerase